MVTGGLTAAEEAGTQFPDRPWTPGRIIGPKHPASTQIRLLCPERPSILESMAATAHNSHGHGGTLTPPRRQAKSWWSSHPGQLLRRRRLGGPLYTLQPPSPNNPGRFWWPNSRFSRNRARSIRTGRWRWLVGPTRQRSGARKGHRSSGPACRRHGKESAAAQGTAGWAGWEEKKWADRFQPTEMRGSLSFFFFSSFYFLLSILFLFSSFNFWFNTQYATLQNIQHENSCHFCLLFITLSLFVNISRCTHLYIYIYYEEERS
jgi:hypothetical protein